MEQGNFAIRKRLLEYDNVMNSQREVIYKKRKHALLGERLHLDTMSMIHDTVRDLLTHHEGSLEHKALHLDLLKIFGKEVTPDTLSSQGDLAARIQQTYQATLQLYEDRKSSLQTKVWPLIAALDQNQDAALQQFSLPFSDGETKLYVAADLQACVTSKGKALINSVERAVILHSIDHHWKEHLRAMDDLKQSVQNAVYERQDPLLIYKFEGYKLFQKFIQKVTQATIAFLNRSDLQLPYPDIVQKARHESDYTHLQESKQSGESLLYTNEESPGTATNVPPLKSQKVAQRNQRVTVRYADGRVKKNVKFKTVEEDIANKKCVLVESH